MNKVLTTATSVALVLAAMPAPAGPQVSKKWTRLVIDQELRKAERRINQRVGQQISNLSLSSQLADPFHAALPMNTELTLAAVGEDDDTGLDVVALCGQAESGEVWAGIYVTSLTDFLVSADPEAIPADALGVFVRWTGAEENENGDLVAMGDLNRTAVAVDGEVFAFGEWAIVWRGDDECGVTAMIDFGTNGSDVAEYPDGMQPVPIDTEDGFAISSWFDTWKARRFPWLPD